jgi:hypothetical protein
MKSKCATFVVIATVGYAHVSSGDTITDLSVQSGAGPVTFPAPPARLPSVVPGQPVGPGPALGNIVLPGSGGRRQLGSCNQPVPRGSLVDANQDVWLGGQKVQHLSPCQEAEPAAGGWLESATQNVSYYYFTELFIELYVPNAPPSPQGPVFFLWPGIEATVGTGYTLLQPVLQWNQGGSGIWQMQDYVISTTFGIGGQDYPGIVYPGDNIWAVVQFDSLNPGSSCQTGVDGGANCNYWVAWWDVTSGHTNSGGFEQTVPNPLNYAQGAVFEAYMDSDGQQVETGFPTGCADFPGTSVFGDTAAIFWGTTLYEGWSPSTGTTLVAQDTPNFMTTQYPNAGSGWLTNVNNNHVNCGYNQSNTFSISDGWLGSTYVFSVGY